jgi:hypothetical protein
MARHRLRAFYACSTARGSSKPEDLICQPEKVALALNQCAAVQSKPILSTSTGDVGKMSRDIYEAAARSECMPRRGSSVQTYSCR